jgi:alpha-amylase/alpha-mannosidase (GH57 family)
MERYICVHGHFYQPPRQNPWLDAIELQGSAHPYHDWNERITAECYAPNTAARLLDNTDQIAQIVNNYARMSFNFGPTLLAWLEQQAPEVYEAVLAADRESQTRFAGHGSALAQAYNHLIMPLANRRDKGTQIVWGIRDFVHRFGRHPEGMWLPETAVDLETLDLLAEYGIRFTILSPTQACRVRARSDSAWRDVSGGRIDPTMPYVQHLPSGRQISVFFYHAALARGVAFEHLLNNGKEFVEQLLGAFHAESQRPQLVHVATDGETYGHHHRFGEMALAYALDSLETHSLARLTNYGAYLEHHPPTHEVEIIENTAWSCAHGIERWRSNCGCRTGGPPGWQQAWRTPLREALDWLRDTLAVAYEQHSSQVWSAPWTVRDDYIAVILDRASQHVARFLHRHTERSLTPDETIVTLKLLEMQHHAMLMYTSCGWFFDELSGLEPRQVLHHAARAIHLARDLGWGETLEMEFLTRLAEAKSNLPEYGDGRQIYERWVRPAMVGWEQVAVQYAMRVLFETSPTPLRVYCYTVQLESVQRLTSSEAQCIIGRARFTSEMTHDTAVLHFGVLHRGEHHLYGGARIVYEADGDQALLQAVRTAFMRADYAAVIRLLHDHFGPSTWSLRALRRDAQRQIVPFILETTLATAETLYRQLYEPRIPLLPTLARLHMPVPKALQTAAEYVVSLDVQRAFEEEELDLMRCSTLLEDSRTAHLTLDAATLQPPISQALRRLVTRLAAAPSDLALLQTLTDTMRLVSTLPFSVELWKVQNVFYMLCHTAYPAFRQSAAQGDPQARLWIHHFRALGDLLAVRVEPREGG